MLIYVGFMKMKRMKFFKNAFYIFKNPKSYDDFMIFKNAYSIDHYNKIKKNVSVFYEKYIIELIWKEI